MKKIRGISYACTSDGIELPVLDITHPLFIESINEEKLKKILQEIGSKAGERAESFNRIPRFIKNFLAKRSYIMAGILDQSPENSYLSGLSTMMMKLGPGLISRGNKGFFDRLASKAVGSVMLRMRVRDASEMLAGSIIESLPASRDKELCLINIGGGAATDSINALIIIHKSDPALLKGKNLEIIILDIDDYGPYFACESIKSLTSSQGVLYGLTIDCKHISYDWENTEPLKNIIQSRKEKLIICSSEGGLFEYGGKNQILNNLEVFEELPGIVRFTGTALKGTDSIDPVILSTLNMLRIRPEFYGCNGLKSIIAGTSWHFERISEINPRYIVFTLAGKKGHFVPNAEKQVTLR